jgi:hypothetical protein
MMRRILFVFGLLLSPVSASADTTGMDLRKLCSLKDRSMCQMFIAGFHWGLFAAHKSKTNGEEVCLPDNLTGEQANLIVEKFIKDNPQALQLPTAQLVFSAFYRAFPCKE